MKVLLIEDEEHKAKDLIGRLCAMGVVKTDLEHVTGVREAVLAVLGQIFDLIIVDMALPTFVNRPDDRGGAAQAVGGIEVLRALLLAGQRTKIIIVTQYPDIIFDGNRLKISQAPRVLSAKYSQDVLGAVLYSYKTPEWEEAFDGLVGRIL